jgi:hypothetical protein
MTARRLGMFLPCCLLFLGGCSLGPEVIRSNLVRYNDAVADTENEQFLLNIVRLRYRDPPKSLAVGSITSSFNFEVTGPTNNIVGVNRGSALSTHLYNLLGFSAQASDVPTISLTPLNGQDFVTGMVAPIPLDRIVVLAHTGWDLDRLLMLMGHNMNGLENAAHLAGQGSDRVPRYAEFVAAARVLGRLHNEGLLELSMTAIPVPVADMSEPQANPEKGKHTEVKASDLMNAADKNYLFHEIDDTKIILQRTVPSFNLTIAPAAWDDPEFVEVAHQLSLEPGGVCYRLVTVDGGQIKRQMEGPGPDIVLSTRSVLSGMLYMSKGVEIPEEHFKEGLVSAPVDDQGRRFDWTQVTDGVFRVRVQKHKPKNAWVCVKYRDYWYYIADNDLTSKSSFDLILQALNVQITRSATSSPVLTVPVNAGGGGGGGGRGGGG